MVTATKDGNVIVFEKYTREPSVLIEFTKTIEELWGWTIEEEIVETNIPKKKAIAGIKRLRQEYNAKRLNVDYKKSQAMCTT